MSTNTKNRTQEIGRIVAVLLAMHGQTQAELAKAIDRDPATITRRLQGRGQWTAGELDAIAAYFNVPITTLFVPLDALADFLSSAEAAARAVGCLYAPDPTLFDFVDFVPDPTAATAP